MISRYGKEIYPSKSFRDSFNFLIQGFSADMIRMAMSAVRQISLRNPHWELTPIATVHDEAVYEVNTKYEEIASKAIKDAFESVVKFCVPVVGEIEKGDNYSEAK